MKTQRASGRADQEPSWLLCASSIPGALLRQYWLGFEAAMPPLYIPPLQAVFRYIPMTFLLERVD